MTIIFFIYLWFDEVNQGLCSTCSTCDLKCSFYLVHKVVDTLFVIQFHCFPKDICKCSLDPITNTFFKIGRIKSYGYIICNSIH